MRYYVVADVHGYFEPLKWALEEKGFFSDTHERKLVVCGDLFDRGPSARKLQDFICELISRDEVILIKGNHEDLMEEMLENFYDYLPSMEYTHHYHNGTFDTALSLTKMNKHDVEASPEIFRKRMYQTITKRSTMCSFTATFPAKACLLARTRSAILALKIGEVHQPRLGQGQDG